MRVTNLLYPFYIHILRAKHIYGFELVDQAVSDARRNANLNGICNATFVQGDLNKIRDNFGEYFPKPDLVITGRPLLRCNVLC